MYTQWTKTFVHLYDNKKLKNNLFHSILFKMNF